MIDVKALVLVVHAAIKLVRHRSSWVDFSIILWTEVRGQEDTDTGQRLDINLLSFFALPPPLHTNQTSSQIIMA